MNIKTNSLIAVLSIAASVFATDSLSIANTTTQATENTPVAESAPITEAEPAITVAPVNQEPSTSVTAPTAVRNGATINNTTISQAPAPTEVRRVDIDTLPPVTYYHTSYTPVKTVYVANESSGDTITLDELRGYVPFKFSLGVQGFLGTYSLTDYDYYSESFTDLTLRAGLTSIFPLNQFSVAMKFSAIYEQSIASNSFYYNERSSRDIKRYHLKFKERKINFPLLFSFKSPRSNLMFDFGAQASLAIYDKLKYSYRDSEKSFEETIDMLDENYRNELEWSLVFGMEFRANKYIALSLRYDCGLSNLYDSFFNDIVKVNSLTSNAFLIGLSFYFL